MEEPHVHAAQKWIDLGVTSATNPIHRFLLAQFFAPLGLKCDYMECDPISDPTGNDLPVFVGPSWSRSRVDLPFEGMLPAPAIFDRYKISASRAGNVEFTLEGMGTVPAALLPLIDKFDSGKELNAMIQKCRLATSRFLTKAFEVACLPAPEGSPAKTELFLRDPVEFSTSQWDGLFGL